MWKRIGKIGLLAVFFLTLTTPAHAGEITVTLTADKTTASLEDIITLEVLVSGSQGASQPIMTHADDFEVQFGGTSSQIQIINGQYSSSKSYRFELIPRKTGTFTVGPAQVNVGGTSYESQPITLVIGQGTTASPNSQGTQGTRDQMAFVETEVSNKNPYVGEQILYTIRFLTLVPAQNVRLETPNFEGFVQESLGDSRSFQRVINGQAWQVSELQWALSPMSAGSTTIPGPRLIGEFLVSSPRSPRSLFDDPFFNINRFFREPRQLTLVGDSVTLAVKPLPEVGKPADFSGLVGSFQIALQAGDHEVEAGQSTTLTVTVKGNGDLRALSELKWQPPSEIKVYDDQPTVTTAPSQNGIIETKTFKKAVVPLKPGDLTLPPVTLNFFNPKLGEYETLDTGLIPLKVTPSTRPEVLVASRDKASTASEGLPTALADARNGSQNTAGRLPSLQFLQAPFPGWLRTLLTALFGLALVAIAVRFILRGRRKKLAADPHYRRRKSALKKALRRMKGLPSRSERSFFEEASFILRDFLGDKLGIDGQALTTIDIREKFPSFGFSKEDVQKISQFLNRCEEGVYGGRSLAKGDKEEILRALKESLVRVNRLTP